MAPCGSVAMFLFVIVAGAVASADKQSTCGVNGCAAAEEAMEMGKESLLQMSRSTHQVAKGKEEAPAKRSIADASAIVDAREAIEAKVVDNPALAAKFLRLAFHDCVGGCDGCVDMTEPDNAGLALPIAELADVVEVFELQGLSRADIWALSGLVASHARQNPRDERAFSLEYYGRVNCEDSNECADQACDSSSGPHRTMPGPFMTSEELFRFFADGFGMTARETVALLGAHSLGSASPENSGFHGTHGWVFNPRNLDNGYYNMLVGPLENPDFGPQWLQVFVDNSQLRTEGTDVPDRYQWEHTKTPDDRGETADRDNKENRSYQTIIMLNTDIAVVRDFSSYQEGSDGQVGCLFRCRAGKDCGADVCPSSSTLSVATEFKFNNSLFLEEFEDVMNKMVNNGYEASPCSQIPCQIGVWQGA